MRIVRASRYVLAASLISGALLATPLGAVASTANVEQGLLPGAALSSQQAASLNDVSCSAVNTCVAVGSYRTNAGNQLLVDSEVDGEWIAPSLVALPAKAKASTESAPNPITELLSVSCPSVGSCLAVGTVQTASGFEPLILTESNSTWAAAAIATLPSDAVTTRQQAALEGIDCASLTLCVAVGTYVSSTAGGQPFSLTKKNGTWLAPKVPALPSAAAGLGDEQLAGLMSVSCPTVTACVAVGSYETETGVAPMVVSESNGTWTTSSSALTVDVPANATSPSGDAADSLNSVWCSAVGSCVAVGQYAITTGYAAMISTETASTWSSAVMVSTPATSAPGEDVATLESVSCVSSGVCQAVGASGTTEEEVPLVTSLAGGVWSSGSTGEIPANAATANPGQLAQYSAVACFSAGECLSVGQYVTLAGTESLTSTPSTAPGPPTSLAVTAGNASALVSWTAPRYVGESPLTTYVATAQPSGATCSTSTLVCRITGLTNGATYSVTVTVANAIAVSAPSAPSAPFTPATVPDAPTILHIKELVGGFRLILAQPAFNGGAPLLIYDFSVNGGTSWHQRKDGTTNTVLVIKGLASHLQCHVAVRAVNRVGPGAPSGVVRSTTK